MPPYEKSECSVQPSAKDICKLSYPLFAGHGAVLREGSAIRCSKTRFDPLFFFLFYAPLYAQPYSGSEDS